MNVKRDSQQPSTIKWQNLTYPGYKKVLRKMLSILFGLILIFISFVVVVFGEFYQNEFSDTYSPDIDCTFIQDYSNYTQIQIEYLSNQTIKLAQSKVNCYCQDKLVEFGISLGKGDSNGLKSEFIEPCNKWLEDKLKYESFNLALGFLLPFLNGIIVGGLTFLTRFERNKSLSNDMYRNMFKCFIVEFVNTAVIIVAVNSKIDKVAKWNSNFFVFAGPYNDINTAWYSGVGVVIAFTMFMNIFTPHFAELSDWALWKLKLIYDQGPDCCKRNRPSLLETKEEILELYVGPEFEIEIRYSSILNCIFVTLMFSSGIPVLYVFMFAYLLLNYWVDKFLLFKFFRKPPPVSVEINHLFNFMIVFGIIIHLCFGIWVYGNQDVFPAQVTVKYFDAITEAITSTPLFSNSVGQAISKRIKLPHNLILFILVILIISYILLRGVVYGLAIIIMSCFCTNKEDKAVEKFEEPEDIFIHDALDINTLYQHNQVRKLNIRRLIRQNISNKPGLSFFEQLNINALALDRYFMVKKLISEKAVDLEQLQNFVSNFEKEIEVCFKTKKFIQESKMQGDSSFNLAFHPEFQSYAYSLLIKEAEIIKKNYTQKVIRKSQLECLNENKQDCAKINNYIGLVNEPNRQDEEVLVLKK